MRRRTAGFAFLLAALFFATCAPLATAHSPDDYYPTRWIGTEQLYFFTASVPTGDWRDRIRAGVRAWNNQAQPMQFSEAPPRGNFDPLVCPDVAGTNGVHRGTFDGQDGALAVTATCSTPDGIYSTNILFDEDEDWYTGTGTPSAGTQIGGACFIGPCEVDLWSVASHEWGHATGFNGPFANGHFDPNDDDLCSEGAQKETMCPSLRKGDTTARTTHTHEEHTFRAAY